MKRLAFPIVAAVLLLASCSVPKSQGAGLLGSPSPTTVTSSRPFPYATATVSPTGKATEPEEEHHDETEPHEGSLSDKYSKDSPPPDTFREADSGDSPTGAGRVPLEMRTKPGCAEVGGSIEVTLRTKPFIQVGVLATVPNEDGKMEDKRGRSGSGGLFTLVVPVPGNLEPGNYTIMAAAADDKGEDGGRSGQWFVVVAERGGCPR